MRRIALTGASGYVGEIISDAVSPMGDVVRLVRRPTREGDVAWTLDRPDPDLPGVLIRRGVTDLVHAAWDMSTSSPDAAQRVCVDGSISLLRAAKAAGVSRIVFISTISAFDGARSLYGRTKRQIEAAVLADGGLVLRLGLVHGQGDGGMFGTIRGAVTRGRFVPMIGSGRGPQYLLDATRLKAAVRRALDGDLDGVGQPITLADEKPIAFRDLVRQIARDEGRQPILVPIPWRILYLGLVTLERFGVAPPVRSDSVVSFVHGDPSPDFSAARAACL